MNWKEIIKELMLAGMTQAEIAAKCGVSQSHVSSLLSGDRKSPSWRIGDSLLRLHKRSRRKSA